jgi:hypothetical protein
VKDQKLDVFAWRASISGRGLAGRTQPGGGLKMKLLRIIIALAAAGFMGGTTFAISDDTPVSPAEAEKIKAALEAFGCTADKIEKESEESALPYEVDDAKCKGGKYNIKLDKDFKVIFMVRD